MRRAFYLVVAAAGASCSPIDLNELVFACETLTNCRDAAIADEGVPRADGGDAGAGDADPDSGTSPASGVCSPSAEETSIDTEHWWCRNMSAAELHAFVDRFGARILDLEIERGGPNLLFTAALERKETGLYFEWAEDLSTADIDDYALRQLELTEINVITRAAGVPRFAAVFETHYGARFYHDEAGAARVRENIVDAMANRGWRPPEHGPRIIDLGRWLDGTDERFSWVIKVRGAARSSTIAFARSPQNIDALNITHNILDFEQTAVNDRFTVVTATRAPTDLEAHFVYAATPEELDAELTAKNAYIRKIAPQRFGSELRWSALLLVNTATTPHARLSYRIGDGTEADFGFIVANTAGSTLTVEQKDVVFQAGETATALIAFYVFERVQRGTATLETMIPGYLPGTLPNLCPSVAQSGEVSVLNALGGMMLRNEYEDIKSLVLHFGEANIERRAAELGLSSTTLEGTLGCPDALPRTSLEDQVRLFRAIATELDEPHRTQLYSIMPGLNQDPGGVDHDKVWSYRKFFDEMIKEESIRAGISEAVRDHFLAEYDIRYVRGKTSTARLIDRSVVAGVDIPTCVGSTPTRETWILAMRTGNTTYPRDAERSLALYRGELFRQPLRAALAGFNCGP